MSTNEMEIPCSQWRVFCDQFSRQHKGRRATIGVVRSETMAEDPGRAEAQMQKIVQDVPLVGISVDRKIRGMELVISAGDMPDHLTHWVRHPLHLWFERTSEDAEVGLTILQATGETTLLRFQPPVVPESPTGLGSQEG